MRRGSVCRRPWNGRWRSADLDVRGDQQRGRYLAQFFASVHFWSVQSVFMQLLFSRQRTSRIGKSADLRKPDDDLLENILSSFESLASQLVLLSHGIIQPQSAWN